jgi:hypothetical protein
VRIETGRDGVVIELPTAADADRVRLEIERRVVALLRGPE